MRIRTRNLHPGSFLVGILIGVAAILVMMATLPSSRLAISPGPAQNGIVRSLPALVQVRVDQAGFQIKTAWNHAQTSIKSFSFSAAVRRPCLQVRTWYNQQDEKLVSYLTQHGIHLPLWLMPLKVCA